MSALVSWAVKAGIPIIDVFLGEELFVRRPRVEKKSNSSPSQPVLAPPRRRGHCEYE
jgi:hypothetical protein